MCDLRKGILVCDALCLAQYIHVIVSPFRPKTATLDRAHARVPTAAVVVPSAAVTAATTAAAQLAAGSPSAGTDTTSFRVMLQKESTRRIV